MQDISLHLEALRDLLYDAPHPGRWTRLLAIMADWPQETVDIGLDYALMHLQGWPDALRVAPPRWMGALRSGGKLPGAWALARCVDLTVGPARPLALAFFDENPHTARLTHLRLPASMLTLERAVELASSPSLRGIRALTLTPTREPVANLHALDALVKSKCMARLHALDIPRANVGPQGARLLAKHATELRKLGLGYNALTGWGLEPLTKAQLPHLETLDLSGNGLIGAADMNALSSAPWLPRLRSLNLDRNPLTNTVAELVTGHETPWALETLSMVSTTLMADDFKAMAQSPALSNLQTLKLGDAMLSDHSVWRLASSHWLKNLRHLTLSVRQGNIDGARPLMDALRGGKLQTLSLRGSHGALNDAATWAPKLDLPLKSLNVEGCGLQDDAFKALLGSAALAQIEDLRFKQGNESLTQQGIELLAQTQGAPSLRSLDLDGLQTRDNDALLQTLGAAPRLRMLHTLNINRSPLTRRGIQAIVDAQWTLKRLEIKHASLTPSALEPLLQAPQLCRTIKVLRLKRNNLGDGGMRILAQCDFAQLQILDLTQCLVTGQGLLALQKAPWWPGLIGLELSTNPLYNDDVQVFQQNPAMNRLAHLALDGTRLSSEGIRDIARSPTLGNLSWLQVSEHQHPGDRWDWDTQSKLPRECVLTPQHPR